MKQFELNKDYYYVDIEKADLNNNEGTYLSHLGNELIGEHFVVIKCPIVDKTCSFMLTSCANSGFIYKCIYNDWTI